MNKISISNKRSASLLVCLAFVVNMMSCNFSKDTFVSFKNDDKDKTSVSEDTINLTDALRDYFVSTNDLGLQDDMGLSEEKYQELLNRNFGTCSENNSYTSEEIYKQIEDNTSKYILENKNYNDCFSDYYYNNRHFATKYGLNIEGENLIKVKDQIIKTLKSNIDFIMKNGDASNIHNYRNLKIVLVDGFSRSDIGNSTFADYNSKDDVIRINISLLVNDMNSIDDVLARIDEVVSHELRHVEQGICADEKGKKEEALVVDDEYFNILGEASAESSLVNLGIFTKKDEEPDMFYYTYPEYRDLENQMFLCSIFDNSKTLDEYYDAIRKHDNNRILEFLGATTLEEKRELLRMIYAINSMNYRTIYLRSLTNKSSGYDDNDIYKMTDNIKYLYYITIMKYSLRSLINYNLESIDYSLELAGLNDNVLLNSKNNKNNVGFDELKGDTNVVLGKNNKFTKNNKLSLEENVFLYYLIMSNLVNGSYMETNEVRSYYSNFLDEYESIKKSYFKILSSIYKVDVSTIEAMFLSYNDSEINYELGCYYGNMIGDGEFNDMVVEHQDLIKGLLEKFTKLKYTAFLKYREIKEERYMENDSVEVIEDVINSKNTCANYTVRTGK